MSPSTTDRSLPGIDGAAKAPIEPGRNTPCCPRRSRWTYSRPMTSPNHYAAPPQLTGVDHHTVARYVAARAAGRAIDEPSSATQGERCLRRQDRRVGRSFQRQGPRRRRPRTLIAMGYTGSERTTRRVVAITQDDVSAGHTTGSTSPGSPNPGSGSNTTSATAPSSTGPRRCCSAPGWPGAASGSSSPWPIARCRRWSPPSTPRFRLIGGAPDLRADRQRKDGDRPPHRRHRGAQRDHGGGVELLRGDHLHLRAL